MRPAWTHADAANRPPGHCGLPRRRPERTRCRSRRRRRNGKRATPHFRVDHTPFFVRPGSASQAARHRPGPPELNGACPKRIAIQFSGRSVTHTAATNDGSPQFSLPQLLAGGTNHGKLIFRHSIFGPLILATSHPSCLTVPSIVAVLPFPPSSILTAVIWKVRLAGLIVPVARAIACMLFQVITPDSVLFAPTTMCQSAEGQAPLAFEVEIVNPPLGELCRRNAACCGKGQRSDCQQLCRCHSLFLPLCSSTCRRSFGSTVAFLEEQRGISATTVIAEAVDRSQCHLAL